MKRFLRTLACTLFLGAVAAAAQAQARVFVGVRAPFRPAIVAAVPPCPGIGYTWVPGYYVGAIWYPGRWIFRGYDRGYVVRGYSYGFHRDYYRGYYDHDRFYRR